MGLCAIWNIRAKHTLNSNIDREISFAHNICLSCPFVLKFALSKVALPCSVQNFKTIGSLLCADEIKRDLSLRWVSTIVLFGQLVTSVPLGGGWGVGVGGGGGGCGGGGGGGGGGGYAIPAGQMTLLHI